jgi:hypothetical protein
LFYKEFIGTEVPVELQMELLNYNYDEMMECALGYVDVVSFWLKNKEVIGDVLWYGLEKGIPVFPEHGCFGTADCVIVGTKGSVIIDYKHGKGKNVSATSLQLKVYASGIAKHLENIPEGYLFHAVVFQPRTDSAPKETHYELNDLNDFLNRIEQAVYASKEKSLEPCEGNHCFWCPAKRTKDQSLMCPKVKEKPMKLAEENFKQIIEDMRTPIKSLSDPNPKRDEALIKIMTLLPLMQDIAERATEEFKYRIIDKNEAIPGVRIVDKYGKRTLNGESDEDKIKLLKANFPSLNPIKIIPQTSKLKTITEIEKEIGKNKLDHVCVKKITKEIDILDDKMRAILGDLAMYGQIITNNKE